jgi:putative phosphoesterase
LIFGILSDTHKKVGRAQRVIDMLVDNGAAFLIHAGDIGKEETLVAMEATGLPYVAVLGNNDRRLAHLKGCYPLFTEPHYFEAGGLRVKLMHHPFFLTPDADLVVCGHLHRFYAKTEGATLFLNPGEACARNKPVSEAALLEVTADEWRVTHCQRRLKEQVWHYSLKRFPRIAEHG